MKNRPRGELRRRAPVAVEFSAGGVGVLESHHAADFQMEPDVWPMHKLCWVAMGRGVLELEGGASPIERNDFLLLPADRPHRFVDRPGDLLTLVILCLSKEFLAGAGRERIAFFWNRLLERHAGGAPIRARSAFHRGSLTEDFGAALREQGRRCVGWGMALEAIALRLLIRFGRGYCTDAKQTDSSRNTVAGAVEYLDARPYEALQVADMAARCGLSPRRFTDLFKEQTGETFNHYLNHRRIEYACRRLAETGHILYACYESGFNDLAYFYRVFKKHTGRTPGAYLASSSRSAGPGNELP